MGQRGRLKVVQLLNLHSFHSQLFHQQCKNTYIVSSIQIPQPTTRIRLNCTPRRLFTATLRHLPGLVVETDSLFFLAALHSHNFSLLVATNEKKSTFVLTPFVIRSRKDGQTLVAVVELIAFLGVLVTSHKER